ncbi:MFS transporter [Thermocrispum municipale]|uniref:MFS transporter n=1 Tax=Thermocrispum municipale TaxID=37926 RepID=UPI00040481B2|nr:MFS transporter [Thermocrispum municipale]
MSTASTSRPGQSDRTGIGKVVGASMIGTTIEWYDFFLFGSAAALVFGDVFFDELGGTTGTLYSFMVYALGFVARPLGGMVFGHFGDRIGRKKMLVLSLLLMGGSTFAIGLLPTYAQVGILAPLLLVACRLVQGFAVGGEWGGAVLMAAEHGHNTKRGFWTSFVQAGVPAGNLIAAGALWILQGVLTPEQFLSWGWRVSFLLSAVLVFIGLWVRLSIEESPVFAATQAQLAARKERTHQPLLEVIKHYPKEILLAMGMRLAENISYYIFTVISISYLKDYLDTDGSLGTQAVLIGSAVQVIAIPLIGIASDRFGRKPFYLAGAIGVGVWTFVFFGMLDSASGGMVALAVTIGLLFHALMYSPQAAFFSELFGTSVRYTGASIGYQLASVAAGALAPIVAIALLGDVNDPNDVAVGIYVAIASVLTIISVLFARETRGESLEHDRTLQPAAATS